MDIYIYFAQAFPFSHYLDYDSSTFELYDDPKLSENVAQYHSHFNYCQDQRGGFLMAAAGSWRLG